MKGIVAFAFFFLLTAMEAVAQTAVGSQPCISSQPDGETAFISIPSEAIPTAVEVHWKLEEMDLDGERSKTIRFQVDPFATGTFRVTAVDPNGHVLCVAVIDPKTYITNTVPYSDSQPLSELAYYFPSELIAKMRSVPVHDRKNGQDAAAKKKSINKKDQLFAKAPTSCSTASSSCAKASTSSAKNTASTAKSQMQDFGGYGDPKQSIMSSTAEISSSSEWASASVVAPPKFATTGNVIKVHFVTERKPSSDSGEMFTTERNPDASLRYGMALVTVPESHKRMFVTDPIYWTFKQSDFSAQFTPALSESDFYKSLASNLAKTDPNTKQVMVFIHGFNNGFLEDIYKTAQLAYDTRFVGIPIMFDWPTKNGFLDYSHDRTQVDNSKQHLAEFLQDLAAKSGAGTINIVAHSMGNRLLLEALDILRRENKLPQLGQIVMAAPDVDSDRFVAVTQALVAAGVVKKITLYGSRKDWAMWASKKENGGLSIVGALPPEVPLKGIDQIDASALPMNYIGHDYFITSKPVLTDIGLLLRGSSNLPRNGLSPVPGSQFSFWRFASQ